jgi:hypothetical protein
MNARSSFLDCVVGCHQFDSDRRALLHNAFVILTFKQQDGTENGRSDGVGGKNTDLSRNRIHHTVIGQTHSQKEWSSCLK